MQIGKSVHDGDAGARVEQLLIRAERPVEFAWSSSLRHKTLTMAWLVHWVLTSTVTSSWRTRSQAAVKCHGLPAWGLVVMRADDAITELWLPKEWLLDAVIG